jgi:hypothetical protein
MLEAAEMSAMPIQLSPESERLVEQQIASGHFHSVDEIIHLGVHARDSDGEAERWRKHREAIDRTRSFITDNPIRLTGVTFQEVVDEGRRL